MDGQKFRYVSILPHNNFRKSIEGALKHGKNIQSRITKNLVFKIEEKNLDDQQYFPKF